MFLINKALNKDKFVHAPHNFFERPIVFFEKYSNFATDKSGLSLITRKKAARRNRADIMKTLIHNHD